ncbi:MAG: hypothetical protein NVSMB64_03940 [Candidatus Velthaea sp.]
MTFPPENVLMPRRAGSPCRLLVCTAAMGLIFLGVFGPARADELVMFEQAGCPYCARWNKEIGSTYGKTDEAKSLPLRRVDIHAERPARLAEISGVRFTPTFVVVHCGKEVARITGYAGDEQFWGLLDASVNAIKETPKCT